MFVVYRKSAYPFGQVKTKMYLPKSAFFKKALAGASWLVLMSVLAALARTTNYIAPVKLSPTYP